ncbi:unnamed protein product (macronuclear) [Paramecium tetraurelia]|uniref:Lsm14-like N-terminal domain-containing protein n=1 Tax=Paramecium tetraurelia TaxID=5888 RepID=A0DHZ1_PARTE|nr:uncharacterized protein GSPATT00017029001 [Paramecium tetraurelia]CAK82658.1 unnamed protein product [Paramecium tetraurelia]|eukprot:XP_001450055.1 hypothetical protein (macronuclear) [Paramecium tetraurelia strain d4-2]
MKQNRVSILTKQNIRYEGIVYAIDKIRKTVFLKEVKCFGTENREATVFIPPSTKITQMAEFNNEQILEIKKLSNNEFPEHLPSTLNDQMQSSQKEKIVSQILNQSCTYEMNRSPLPLINNTKKRYQMSQSPDHRKHDQKPTYITNNYLQMKKMEQFKKMLMFRKQR